MNAAKLAAMQAQVRIGGKGSTRRKVKKVQKTVVTDQKKLDDTLKKLNVQSIANVDEVNMFQKDSKILHFSRPQVSASVASNTFVIKGSGVLKELTQLLPGILSQLGDESLEQLRIMAADAQAQSAATKADDDDIPELVDNETFDGEDIQEVE